MYAYYRWESECTSACVQTQTYAYIHSFIRKANRKKKKKNENDEKDEKEKSFCYACVLIFHHACSVIINCIDANDSRK